MSAFLSPAFEFAIDIGTHAQLYLLHWSRQHDSRPYSRRRFDIIDDINK